MTFAQFLYVTIQTVSSQLYFPTSAGTIKGEPSKSWTPRVRKRGVPIKRWMVQVLLFLGVSLSELIVASPRTRLIGSEQLCVWAQGNLPSSSLEAGDDGYSCNGLSSTDPRDGPYHLSEWWTMRFDVDGLPVRSETVLVRPNCQSSLPYGGTELELIRPSLPGSSSRSGSSLQPSRLLGVDQPRSLLGLMSFTPIRVQRPPTCSARTCSILLVSPYLVQRSS